MLKTERVALSGQKCTIEDRVGHEVGDGGDRRLQSIVIDPKRITAVTRHHVDATAVKQPGTMEGTAGSLMNRGALASGPNVGGMKVSAPIISRAIPD